MAFEVKPNTGSVWINDRKTEEKHPDRTGQGVIECPHCGKSWAAWINGWLREAKGNGKPFLSLSFRPKDERGDNQQSQDRGNQERGGGNYGNGNRGGQQGGSKGWSGSSGGGGNRGSGGGRDNF